MLDDPIEVALLVVEAMNTLEIPYLIAGSLASSIHGIARATRDVDIVADIQERHAKALTRALSKDFYADCKMIKDAIKHQSFFNVIHLFSMFKIDIYVLSQERFSIEEFKRRQEVVLIPSPKKTAFVATPEDIILSKLVWFRMGGEVSDTQLRDVLGVMKVQRCRLDMEYLNYWAGQLNVSDLLKRSLKEAGIE